MLHDFTIPYQAGQALLAGQSPYSVPEFFYPFPTTFLFTIFALLPFGGAIALWTVLSATVLILVARRAAPLWFLFPPVIACLLQGRMDLFVLGLWAVAGGMSASRGRGEILPGMALALMMLKPQVSVVLIPWQLWQWRGTRRWRSFALTILLLYGLPTLIWPGWIHEFLTHLRPLRSAASISPSVFLLTRFSLWLLPLSLVLAAALLYFARGRGPGAWTAASLAVNPTVHLYDLALLADRVFLWRTVAVCWPIYLLTLAFASGPQGPLVSNAPFLVVPLVALWERSRFHPAAVKR